MTTVLLLSLIVREAGICADKGDIFARNNLVAWCIVPFDTKKRGPEERGRMLEKLGITKLAYDWRAEHIPTFDAEVAAMNRHGVEMTAWWFPGALNSEARAILDCIRRNNIHPQLWVMLEGGPHLRLEEAFEKNSEEQKAHVERMVAGVKPIAAEAAKLGCKVALYNHGGWFGVPENQIEIVQRLKQEGIDNVGMVYTQHHGHGEIDRFEELFPKMKPYLLAITLNGMIKDGDLQSHELGTAPLGQGEQDLRLLRIIKQSGWTGPVGIILEVMADAELRLQDNLDGLDWLTKQLDGGPAGPKPQPRTWERPKPSPRASMNPGSQSTSGGKDYWAIEDAAERQKLPLYRTIAAAKIDQLTPANGCPKPDTFVNWSRSHGDNSSARYSALAQINRQNVSKLQTAWTYHSRDGTGNIQCNPVIMDGVMFAPTSGDHVVAVNAESGKELWRFKLGARPAHRGLVYWHGESAETPRIYFVAGKYAYALEARTGKLIENFGINGRAPLAGGATAGPAIFEHVIIVPGYERDVWGLDLFSGKLLWTFHTIPQAGEFGAETWDQPVSYGANCWGGMALDEARGIAFITTGSPKDNMIGVGHRGDNLFANCVIALDARTGKRLWHFQEIHHDIWDLDIPAPPNLLTITREGRRVDVVAAVTKAGNTLLLDRVTGKPIFPYRERRAPASKLRGEQTSPYQPDIELPEPFSRIEFRAADITTRSEEAETLITTRFKSSTTGFFEPFTEGRMNLFFGIHGGAEWTGACVDPESGHLFVSANHIPWLISVFRDDDPPDDPRAPRTRGREVFETTCAPCHGTNRVGVGTAPPLRGLRHRLTDDAILTQVRKGTNGMPANVDLSDGDLKALIDFLMLRDRTLSEPVQRSERPRYSYNGYPKSLDQDGYPGCKPPWGTLNSLDLNTGKLLWKVPLGEYPELTRAGLAKTGTENFGGPSVTAGGLVFCAGTRDARIRAFDKDTGAELWASELPFVGSAPPSIYEVNGREFIVVPATGGGKLGTAPGDCYVAFALPTTKRLASDN